MHIRGKHKQIVLSLINQSTAFNEILRYQIHNTCHLKRFLFFFLDRRILLIYGDAKK